MIVYYDFRHQGMLRRHIQFETFAEALSAIRQSKPGWWRIYRIGTGERMIMLAGSITRPDPNAIVGIEAS